MTLLFVDGCQGGDSTKWTSFGGSRNTSVPRFAGGATLGSGSYIKTITASSEVWVAVAKYWSATTIASDVYFSTDAGASQQITVVRNANRLLELRRGTISGTVLATGTTVIPDGTWAHLQVHCIVNGTTGVIEVRLNGSTTVEVSYTGNTKNGGTSNNIDTVGVANTSAGYLTDVAILNSAGSANNTWPGDCRVQTLVPTGAGTTTQGTASTGSNWSCVDELPYSSTDYVGMSTTGNGDTYALADLPAGAGTVKGVQVNMSVAKSDAGTRSVQRRVRSGGTDYTGTAVVLSTSFVTVSEVLEQDPATAAGWTVAGVNALEAGFQAA